VSERGLLAEPDRLPAAHTKPSAVPLAPPQRPAAVSSAVREWIGSASPGLSALSRAVLRTFALELDRGTAFLFAPVFMAVGAVVYFALPAEPGVAPLAALALLALAMTWASRGRIGTNLAAAAILMAVGGALLAKMETLRADTKVIGAEVVTRLTGRVASVEQMSGGRARLTIDVAATERPTLRYAPERIRVTARRLAAPVEAGSLITGLVRLMPPSGPVRPGSYDFSFESYFDGIGASGFFMSGPTVVAEREPLRPGLRATVENFRNHVAERVRQRIGGAEGEVAAALIVGVRAGIPETLSEAMRTTGLYHVISISGLHMALVAGTLMSLLRSGFALFPDFSARHPVKKLSAVLALAGITLYLLISGGEVAAQRSYLMLAVMLSAILFDRAALTLRNLAISAIVVIALSPHEVVGPSFQMSFAATAALVGAYAAWSEYGGRRQAVPVSRPLSGRVLRYAGVAIAGLAATSIVAGFSTSIFAVYHFQRIAPLSLVANLAAMPIVSTVVMPFAVLAALAMPFGLDGPFLEVMGRGIAWMSAIATWLAERSPPDSVGVIPGVSVALLSLALVLATLGTTWLRVSALLPAIVGLLLVSTARTPDVLVSEDARLVGVAIGPGAIAFNRSRPSAFTAQNWQRAMNTPERRAPTPVPDEPAAAAAPGLAFACDNGLCFARQENGWVVAHAANGEAMARACGHADLIVVEDATIRRRCATGRATVVTARDLARHGALAVYLDGAKATKPALTLEYAVSEPYRPWHQHRVFSRAARGLAPYARKPAASGTGVNSGG
ncbi:MAG: ComEC/Rec2 family competence protein, partial [Rhizobiaceae bacterium]|nr:ComEC/Rec2 family competence protein [Rhizobiaceae bacterium]